MNDLPERATIQADLAEKFSGPCLRCDEGGEVEVDAVENVGPIYGSCPDCQGSGCQYSFRAKCPECKRFPGFRDECPKCLGLGYIYTATLDTFRAAFLARGWAYRLHSAPEGDAVRILSIPGEDADVSVISTEGLTGMAALEAAAWRTLEDLG